MDKGLAAIYVPKSMKPTAVIDKSLLQPICAIRDEHRREHCLRFLLENFTIYAPVMLIEEIAANYFQPTKKTSKQLALRMLRAASRFHLIEHPLELIYQEVMLKRDVSKKFELDPVLAADYRRWISKPNTHVPELGQRFRERYQNKIWMKSERRQFQQPLKGPTAPYSLNFETLSASILYSNGWLRQKLHNSKEKMDLLSKLILEPLAKLHPDTTPQTAKALLKLDPSRAPYTHDYLLAYSIYLLAPVASVGPENSKRVNPCVLSGNQINNNEDTEYITSALLCDHLLTCDKRMHSMAEMHKTVSFFRHKGKWPRSSIYVPRTLVKRAANFLKTFLKKTD